ncbi:glycosyltransferase [Flaviaesturariibacter terrae]
MEHTDRKNILVLVEHFGQGGAERVALMLAQLLHESSRYRVSLYAIHNSYPAPQLEGIRTGTLDIGYAGGFRKIGNYYRKISRLAGLKKELRSDLTISSLWPVDWMNALTGKDRRMCLIQINILNNPQNALMVKLRPLVTRVYNSFDKVIVGGANLIPELVDFFRIRRDKLEVMQNPVEIGRVEKNLREALPAKLEGPFARYRVCVAANRLAAIKNTAALAPIFKSLRDQEGTKFLIIGEGEEAASVRRAVTDAGLRYSQVEDADFDETAHFYFLNFQQNIHNIISRAALFLFPTKGEGLPLALLEAFACAVPALVSDCPNGGISEVMEGAKPYDPEHPRTTVEATSAGFLMPIPEAGHPATIAAWKETIESLLAADEDRIEKIKEGARARARDFDTEKTRQKWEAMIEAVLQP